VTYFLAALCPGKPFVPANFYKPRKADIAIAGAVRHRLEGVYADLRERIGGEAAFSLAEGERQNASTRWLTPPAEVVPTLGA
jgi:hypothetical protein